MDMAYTQVWQTYADLIRWANWRIKVISAVQEAFSGILEETLYRENSLLPTFWKPGGVRPMRPDERDLRLQALEMALEDIPNGR